MTMILRACHAAVAPMAWEHSDSDTLLAWFVDREAHNYTKSPRRRGDGASFRMDSSASTHKRFLALQDALLHTEACSVGDLAERSAALKFPVLLLAAFLSQSGNSYA